MVQYSISNTLGEFNLSMVEHKKEYEKRLGNNSLKDISLDIAIMRSAIEKVFGLHRIIVGGEQSTLPLPKMAAKLIAMKALSFIDDQITTINIRADHDLVLSESEILSMNMPHPGTDIGTVKIKLLSDKLLMGRPIISGVDLNNPEVFKYVAKQLLHFAEHIFPEAYQPSLRFTGNNKLEGDTNILQAENKIVNWLACYGIDNQGNKLKTFPKHLLSSPKNKSGCLLSQVELKLPSNLAEANDNWFLWLQKQFDIDADYTFSEGVFDKFLLQNKGYEILQKRWFVAVNKLREMEYQFVTSKLNNDQPNTTFFNVARYGQRYYSFFDDNDDSMIAIVDPISKHEEKISIQELFDKESEWAISLTAVPRVVLYSLAGLEGHIKGGGSRYNLDAQAIMDIIGMPYFPLWNFTEKNNDIWTAPIQYTSISTEKELRSNKQHHFKSAGFTTQAVSEGKINLLDLYLSTNPQITSNEVNQWINLNREKICRDDRIYLTNLAGRNPRN